MVKRAFRNAVIAVLSVLLVIGLVTLLTGGLRHERAKGERASSSDNQIRAEKKAEERRLVNEDKAQAAAVRRERAEEREAEKRRQHELEAKEVAASAVALGPSIRASMENPRMLELENAAGMTAQQVATGSPTAAIRLAVFLEDFWPERGPRTASEEEYFGSEGAEALEELQRHVRAHGLRIVLGEINEGLRLASEEIERNGE